MLSSPKTGDRVQVWYATKPRRRGAVVPAEVMPHHGKCGLVEIAGRGRPRNHMVLLDDGDRVIVPAGNLRPEPEPTPSQPG